MNLLERMQQEDKTQHIICAFMSVVLLSPLVSIAAAAALVFVLGLLKEGWDYRVGTGFCWYDVVANALGIAFAVFCLLPLILK